MVDGSDRPHNQGIHRTSGDWRTGPELTEATRSAPVHGLRPVREARNLDCMQSPTFKSRFTMSQKHLMRAKPMPARRGWAPGHPRRLATLAGHSELLANTQTRGFCSKEPRGVLEGSPCELLLK